MDSNIISQSSHDDWIYKCLSNDMIDWLLQYKQLITNKTNNNIHNLYLLYIKDRFPENICMHLKHNFIFYGTYNQEKYWIDIRLLENDWVQLFEIVSKIVLENEYFKYKDAGVLENIVRQEILSKNKSKRNFLKIFTLCTFNRKKKYLNVD